MKADLRSCCLVSALFVVGLLAVVDRSEADQGLGFCCDEISSDSICNETCIQTLSSLPAGSNLTPTQIQVLSSACSPTYTTFWGCINSSIVTEPISTAPPELPPYYYCCAESGNPNCRAACEENLASSRQFDFDQLVADLSQTCGLPPEDDIWFCFLAYEPPVVTEAPDPSIIPEQPLYADWARVQCCYKAVADECKTSCLELYSGQVSSSAFTTFHFDCIHRPSEVVLSTCLFDVSTPCKLGCSDLHFCSGFNNRPDMSFRQCTASADRMAKTNYQFWSQSGVIPHPLVTLFVDDMDNCLAPLWKLVACVSHVQPCHSTTHATQICRSDCLKLLGTCSNSEIAPTAVCDIIAPVSSEDHCISLQQFLEPSSFTDTEIERVTNPCTPNPCTEGYFCAINHRCQDSTQACTPYTCQPGCVVGDRPSFVVSEGGGVRVSLVTNSERTCFGYFNCSTNPDGGDNANVHALGGTGVTTSFRPVHQHCEDLKHCIVDNTTHKHQSAFQDECNFCTCFHGRVTCSNRSCSADPEDLVLKYASCDCELNHRPVCTSDARTLPNACIASCLGYESYEAGDCSSLDSCGGSTVCGPDQRCLPQRHVCVSPGGFHDSCPQYTCVSSQDCPREDPVCDSGNTQHSSLCSFITTQSEIGYYGYCKAECSGENAEKVCGVNGETYKSHCHAENSFIAIDYAGPCVDVPGTNTVNTETFGRCSQVICPSLPLGCVGVLSHDSCCPKCGSHMTLLVDKELLQRNIVAMGQRFLSSTDVLRKLRYHILTLECGLFGHVSYDESLSVWVLPTQQNPDTLLVKACNSEAVKLATFINNQTPMLASDPILSHLVAAEVRSSYFVSDPPPSVRPRTEEPLGGADQLLPSVGLVSLLLVALVGLLF